MKTIVFLLDFYVGTALPTFHLASSLQKRGYKVVYLGIPDIEPYVVNQGFTFYSILEEIFPKGMRNKIGREEVQNSTSSYEIISKHFKYILADNSIDLILSELDPVLLVTNYFVSLESLAFWYKHKIPTSIFCSFLREPKLDPASMAIGSLIRMGASAYQFVMLAQKCGCSISSLEELVKPLKHMPEIIACPVELDLPGVNRGENVRYIEPCIREQITGDKEFIWPDIGEGIKLIYISLGSQVVTFLEKGREYYRLFMEVIRRAVSYKWFFIFSFSPDIDLREFEPLPDNVYTSPWVPQLEILKKSSLSINHGGLGSIKECIYYGVPMLIYPLGADQFRNSERVKIRKIGDIGALDADGMLEQIEELSCGGPKTSGLNELQDVFRQRQQKHCGAELIDEIAASLN